MTLLVAIWIALRTLWDSAAPGPLPPLQGSVDRVVIDKSDRSLSLIQDGRAVRVYPVGLGFAPQGDKARQGDGRTPEGTFHIDLRNDASQYHLSLRIDYPQPDDITRAASQGVDPGGEIFIHGQPPGLGLRERLAGDWTAGCIAVTNVSIQEIWRVTPIGTPVEIVPQDRRSGRPSEASRDQSHGLLLRELEVCGRAIGHQPLHLELVGPLAPRPVLRGDDEAGGQVPGAVVKVHIAPQRRRVRRGKGEAAVPHPQDAVHTAPVMDAKSARSAQRGRASGLEPLAHGVRQVLGHGDGASSPHPGWWRKRTGNQA